MTVRLSFLFALLLRVTAGGAEPGGDVGQTIFSSSHRFVVKGLAAADGTTLAQWAEDVSRRIEELTGQQAEFGNAEYIAIKAIPDPSAPRSQVTRAQGYLDGRLQQKLVVVRPADADQEDLLEALCWLILNRQVVRLQSSADRIRALAHVPDWISVGLAQNLYKEQRARNTRAVLELNEQGLSMPMGQIVELKDLPQGRWREKYFCGLAVSWMLSGPDKAKQWQQLIRKLSTVESAVTRAWLASSYFQLPDPGELENEWQVYIQRQSNVIFDFATLEDDRVDKLERLLKIDPREFGVQPPESAPPVLTEEDLIAAQDEPWAQRVGAGLAMKIRLLSVGPSPEFNEVVEGYAALFEAIGRVRGARSIKTLSAIRDKAENQLQDYQRRRAKEKKYVSDVSDWIDSSRAVNSIGAGAPALPSRDEIEKYMDNAAKDFTEP